MTIEELKVIINGETSGLKNAVKDVQNQIGSLSKKVSVQANKINNTIKSSIKNITSSFKSLASSITKILSAALFTGLSRSAIRFASDIEEVQNVVEVAFGDMTAQVEFFAQKVASAFGLSELQAKRAASTYMSMSKAMGISAEASKTMALQTAALSGDMASFYNVSQDIADTALQSIWTGETETLKKFGIVMTEANLEAYRLAEGIKTSYREMSQAEKVALRYNYVMENTAMAQGDFVRTSGSWANQLRILRMRWEELLGAMGTILTHVLLPIIKALNIILGQLVSIAKGFAAIFSPKKEMEKIESNKGGFGGVSDAIDDANESAKKYKRTIFGFDELNVLKDPTSGSGSSAGAGGGFDMDIKEPYDFNALAGSMDTAKITLDQMIEMFNQGVATLDDYILKYSEALAKAGATIGAGFNKLVEGINFTSIGKTIGDGVNAIVGFLNSLLVNIDFVGLGTQFANGVNSIFETVNWPALGILIGQKINALWGTIAGFFTNLDYNLIGTSIADAFSYAFYVFDPNLVADAISSAVNGIITVFATVVNTVNFGEVVTELLQMLATAISQIDVTTLAHALNKLVTDILKSLTASPEGAASFAEVIGRTIAEGIRELNIPEIISEALSAVKVALDSFWSELTGSEALGSFLTTLTMIAPLVSALIPHILTITTLMSNLGIITGKTFGGIGKGFEEATGFSLTFKEKIAMVLGSVKTNVGNAHTAFSTFFSTMNTKWSSNIHTFGTKFKTMAMNMKHPVNNYIKPAFFKIKDVANQVAADAIVNFDMLKTGVINVGKTIGTALTHPITTIKTLFSSLWAVIAANPFTAFIAVLALVTAAFIKAYNTSDEFRARIDALYNQCIKPVIDKIKTIVEDLWNNHLKPIAEKLFMGEGSLLGTLMQVIGKVLDVVAAVVLPIVETFLPMLSQGFTVVVDVIGDVLGGLLTTLEGLIDFIAGVFTGDWKRAWEGIKNIFKGIWESLKGIAKAPINAVIGMINGMIQGVVNGFNAIKRALNGFSITVPDWIPKLGGKHFGFNLQMSTAPQIPLLANGGVLYDSTLVNAGEYPGAKHNPEIVTPQNVMRDTMSEAMIPLINAYIGIGNDIIKAIENKDVDVYMDTTKVTRKITREQKTQAKYSSSSLVLV